MPLVHFFETSFGRTTEREIVLVEVHSGGMSGWGEVRAAKNPFYNEEWTESAWLILRDYVAPRVLNHNFASAAEVAARTSHIRGHNMARGGLEMAVWDLEARQHGLPLYKHIGGGARREIPCGVSIGIQDSVAELLAEDRDRGRRRIPAHQDEDQARLGRGRDPRSAAQVPRYPADGRRQLRLHAGRRGAAQVPGRIRSDDDRAAAGARRDHRSREITGAA